LFVSRICVASRPSWKPTRGPKTSRRDAVALHWEGKILRGGFSIKFHVDLIHIYPRSRDLLSILREITTHARTDNRRFRVPVIQLVLVQLISVAIIEQGLSSVPPCHALFSRKSRNPRPVKHPTCAAPKQQQRNSSNNTSDAKPSTHHHLTPICIAGV
jgi:hypothetical protein